MKMISRIREIERERDREGEGGGVCSEDFFYHDPWLVTLVALNFVFFFSFPKITFMKRSKNCMIRFNVIHKFTH